ncbi:MAG: c-type cytochrome [Planctomycetales bacterium]|nr:c-type cytochrome [Planctomycetales bacterium]
MVSRGGTVIAAAILGALVVFQPFIDANAQNNADSPSASSTAVRRGPESGSATISLPAGERSFGPTDSANRFTYLDHPLDPYYVGRHFPKLTTPQWFGEEDVDAVVVLAIDDMRDTRHYENYLRPIIDRLKQIDGHAGLSIMTNSVDPADPQLQAWIDEGVSIEVHTADHPCPCLQESDFERAKSTYDRCVDQMASIPNNRPVAFRMPCCDSLNTPSPRFWAEIFNASTDAGNHLSIDSSVFQIFTADDPELPGDQLVDLDGQPKFRKYVPFPSFVNTIRNYPYPYVIGRTCWEFPCTVPSDWEAQHLHQPNNPITVADMQTALDLTVAKQGVMNLVFHPHGWIRAEQVVQLIDHAQSVHGNRVRFVSFREAQERLDQYLLQGQPLRASDGNLTGSQLLDLNQDGYLDVITGGMEPRTRLWNPTESRWIERPTPFRVQPAPASGSRQATSQSLVARFGVVQRDRVVVLAPEIASGRERLFEFNGDAWQAASISPPSSARANDRERSIDGFGLRGVFRDIDSDGTSEWIADTAAGTLIERLVDGQWQAASFSLPGDASILPTDATATDHGLRFVDIDQDGADDVIVSTEREFAAYRFVDSASGWSETLLSGQRGEEPAIPAISRSGTNNGAWFHSGTLWVQNEDTHRLSDLVDRMPLETLLDQADPERLNRGQPLARTPERAIRSLRTRSDLEIQLVAAEPLISDPVAFDWGLDGRLWVVEMGDYPLAADGGRVRVLTDEDGDGRYDRSTIFLDGLSYPNGIKVWRDGVLITSAPHVIWAVDRDGDDRADEQEVVLQGFEPGNQQHRVNGLRYGIDHRLYLANGDSGGRIKSVASGQELDISGRDLWYVPAGESIAEQGQIGTTSGQTQFGRNRDDWQHWFGGNNSNPLWHYVIDERYVGRNPLVAPARQRRDVPQSPGAAPIFPLSTTLERFNEVQMANRLTSACSHEIHRSPALGADYFGDSFVCEPVHNLIHRESMQRDGVSWSSQRAADEQRSEFLASDDNWFRPVMIRTGPDGALWVADMYRLVIEHPEWIPADRQAQLDLRSGRDRGRIYRLVPKGSTLPLPDRSRLTDDQWVELLASEHGPLRDMAQQVLIWHGATSAEARLGELLASDRAETRLHALATLHHLRRLTIDQLATAMRDVHPEVRRWSIRFAETRLDEPEVVRLIADRAAVEEAPVTRLQLAATLGESNDSRAIDAMVGLIEQGSAGDPIMAAVIASSLRRDTIEPIATRVLVKAEAPIEIGLRDAVLRSAAGWVEPETFDRWLVDWLPGDLARTSLPLERSLGWQAINAWQEHGRELTPAARRWIENQLEWARGVLDDERLDAAAQRQQVTALSLIGAVAEDTDDDTRRIVTNLTARTPVAVREQAMQSLRRMKSATVADEIVARWSELLPATRASVIDLLISRETWANRLTDALVDGEISVRELGPSSYDRLLRVMGPQLGDRAQVLAASLPSPDRMAIVEQYLETAHGSGDARRGRDVFQKNCANCHRLDAVGNATGPDLAALTNRTPAALLTAILDPNQAIEDKFLQYVAETDDGLQLAGVITNETSTTITLVAADGKEVVLQRDRLLTLASTGRSLMPEGLEAEIDAAAMRDLIEFLRADLPDPKTFEGNTPATVMADGLGNLQLKATQARIYGPSAIFETTYENIGWWSSPDDMVAWTMEVEQPGKYQVELEYASSEGAAGDRFRIEIGTASIDGVVASTGTWDDYVTRVVGTIELEPGEHELTMRSIGPIKTALIDLRSIKLTAQPR